MKECIQPIKKFDDVLRELRNLKLQFEASQEVFDEITKDLSPEVIEEIRERLDKLERDFSTFKV